MPPLQDLSIGLQHAWPDLGQTPDMTLEHIRQPDLSLSLGTLKWLWSIVSIRWFWSIGSLMWFWSIGSLMWFWSRTGCANIAQTKQSGMKSVKSKAAGSNIAQCRWKAYSAEPSLTSSTASSQERASQTLSQRQRRRGTQSQTQETTLLVWMWREKSQSWLGAQDHQIFSNVFFALP